MPPGARDRFCTTLVTSVAVMLNRTDCALFTFYSLHGLEPHEFGIRIRVFHRIRDILILHFPNIDGVKQKG